MTFVRTLVGRKTNIPINAISTILRSKGSHRRVEDGYFLDNVLYQIIKAGLALQEFVLVCIEPIAVVIGCNWRRKVMISFIVINKEFIKKREGIFLKRLHE
jgi:hypothetical protein